MAEHATAEPTDGLTPALDARWLDAADRVDRGLRLTLPAAAVVHLLLVAMASGGLDTILALFGVPPPPAARPKPIGDRAGIVDGVAAEVIDAAEFDKRYIAFKAGRDSADNEAAPQSRASEPAKPPPPTTASIDKPEENAPGETAAPARSKPAKPEPAKQDALTEADVAELLAAATEDLQSGVVAFERPGAARLGDASPFVRGVIRILKRAMPKPAAGLKGRVVVQFLVSLAGEVEAIRVVRSSGRPELDRLVVERVAATRLVAPARDTPPRERLFQITYDYN